MRFWLVSLGILTTCCLSSIELQAEETIQASELLRINSGVPDLTVRLLKPDAADIGLGKVVHGKRIPILLNSKELACFLRREQFKDLLEVKVEYPFPSYSVGSGLTQEFEKKLVGHRYLQVMISGRTVGGVDFGQVLNGPEQDYRKSLQLSREMRGRYLAWDVDAKRVDIGLGEPLDSGANKYRPRFFEPGEVQDFLLHDPHKEKLFLALPRIEDAKLQAILAWAKSLGYKDIEILAAQVNPEPDSLGKPIASSKATEDYWFKQMDERAYFLLKEEPGLVLLQNFKTGDDVVIEFARDDLNHNCVTSSYCTGLINTKQAYEAAFKFLLESIPFFEKAPQLFNQFCLMHMWRDNSAVKIEFQASPRPFDYSKGSGVWRSHGNIPITRSDPFTRAWLAQHERRIASSLKHEQRQDLLRLLRSGEKVRCNFLVNKDGSLKKAELDLSQSFEANQALLNLLLEKMPFEGKPRNPMGRFNTLTASNIDGQLHLTLSQSLIAGRIGELLDQE